MKQHWLVGLLIAAGSRWFLFQRCSTGNFQRPWQHVVNLEDFYQTKIASASPHEPQPPQQPRRACRRVIGRSTASDSMSWESSSLPTENDVTQTNNLYPESIEDISVNRTAVNSIFFTEPSKAWATNSWWPLCCCIMRMEPPGSLISSMGKHVYDWWFKESSDLPLGERHQGRLGWPKSGGGEGWIPHPGLQELPLTTLN